MRLRTWGYFLREAGRGLTSSGWMSLASVSTVAIALFVLAFFGVLGLNINQAATTLNQQVEVRVFFNPQVSPVEEHAVIAGVRTWPGVKTIKFFTRAQALSQLQNEFPHDQELWKLIQQGNPLYDGFDLYARRSSEIPHIAKRLRRLSTIHQVEYQALVIRRLVAVTSILRDAGYAVEALLALATLFIISNTIRLGVYARRREISVMKLVGATDWFIRWPFLLEGLALGIVGAVVADAIVTFGYQWVVTAARHSLAFWPLAPLQQVQQAEVLVTLVGGAAMGLLGSLWAVRRFLRV